MKPFKLLCIILIIPLFLVTGCGEGSTFAADNDLLSTTNADDHDDGFDDDDDVVFNDTVDVSVDIYTLFAATPANGDFKYIVKIANSAPTPSIENTFIISLPPGTAVVSISATTSLACTSLSLTVTCTGGIVVGPVDTTIEIDVTAPAVLGDILASVTASPELTDLDLSDNNDSVITTIGMSTAGIQTQIDAATGGDTIPVGPGLYVGCLDFGGKDVDLQSTGSAQDTMLSASDCGSPVSIGPNGSIVGFTITDFASSGIEVIGTGSLISRNVFENSNARSPTSGNAIDGVIASPVIERNIFRNISCDSAFLKGTVVFLGASSPVIRNNIFENNRCRAINTNLTAGNFPLIINNTFVGNDIGIGFNRGSTQVTQIYRNNIIVGNGIGIEAESGADVDNPVLENNLVFGNTVNYAVISDQTGANGNISSDPLFVDLAAGNYQLQTGSPAIDSGSAVSAPTVDFDGTARPLDGDGIGAADFDIGAFEAPTI